MANQKIMYPVDLSGKVHEIRFDIMALTNAHASLKALGFGRPTTWQLGDMPYDIPEEVVLLREGINGAKRVQRDTKLISIDESAELIEEHFQHLGEIFAEYEDEQEAMQKFQEAQQLLMRQIAEAVQAAIGFRVAKGKRDEPVKPKSGKAKRGVEPPVGAE
jgi:hypothetical protein